MPPLKKMRGQKQEWSARKQVIVRMWPEDVIKMKLKIKEDNTTVQFLIYGLIKEYINDNNDIRKYARKYSKYADASRMRRNVINNDEAERLLAKLEHISPLSDLDISMEGDEDVTRSDG